MSNIAFVLAILAIGIGYFIFFSKMKRNYRDRNPGEKHNPIDEWLWGKRPEDQDEDREP